MYIVDRMSHKNWDSTITESTYMAADIKMNGRGAKRVYLIPRMKVLLRNILFNV